MVEIFVFEFTVPIANCLQRLEGEALPWSRDDIQSFCTVVSDNEMKGAIWERSSVAQYCNQWRRRAVPVHSRVSGCGSADERVRTHSRPWQWHAQCDGGGRAAPWVPQVLTATGTGAVLRCVIAEHRADARSYSYSESLSSAPRAASDRLD